jgi:hypothetical protein|tara:strand:- start:191 stop:1069 length:879 start_codon:yes stop_codon:yes gene_type:complete
MTKAKTLDTLVEDIEGLFDGSYIPGLHHPQDKTQKHMDEMLSAIEEAVKTSLATSGKKRDIYLRMSNIGKPDKQLWYEHQKDMPKEKLRPDTYIKFLYGHIIEALLLFLAKEAGHEVTHEQAEVEIDNVKGHMDCMIDGVPVDVKSASKYSFEKFKTGELYNDDPFGYIAQISAYVQANNKKEGAFLVMEKSLGKLTVMNVADMEMIDAKARIAHMKKVVDSSIPPDRCHEPVADGKSGNEKLCVQCSYCPYKEDCWSDANDGQGLSTYLYSSGPRYLVTTVKEPKVDKVNV